MAFRRLRFKQHISHRWWSDPGLLLALALALVAASPFLTRPGLPRGTDAELHVFRAAELGYSLRQGELYPRWAPDFYYGYGYPIFNYYAPLTYYLGNLFQLGPGNDIVSGVKLVFVLGLVGAALGMYLFVRDWIGPRAGLLGAALYVYSPFVFFIDPHVRGVLAESFSLGLFPLALWAYRRLLLDTRRRWIAVGAILQAALIMSHNLQAVVLSALLMAFLFWELGHQVVHQWRQQPPSALVRRCWPVWGRVLLTVALGVGLSAIFWLPMIVERGDVQLTLTGPGHFDFHNHFLSLGELLAPSSTLDLGAAALDFRFNLGLPQWPLALLALLALLSSPGRRHLAVFFVLCTLGLVALMLPVSTPIWEAAPGMAFLQFPWRLLGAAGVALSIVAAAGYAALISERNGKTSYQRRAAVTLGLGIGLTLWLALPAMYPPLWEADFGPTDPLAMIQFELSGVAVGTTSTGDYLPTSVEISPHPEPAYLATYTRVGGVDKVNRATLPAGTTVETISRGPTHDRFQVASDKPFTLRLFTHFFPGWRASVDGKEVPIELGRPEGFITVAVPSGMHTVEVRLGALATPARKLGTLLSLLSLLALVPAASMYRAFERSRAEPSTVETTPQGRGVRLDRRAWLAAGGVLAAFVLIKAVLVDRQHDWFRYTSPPGEVLGAQYPLSDAPIRFGSSIQLLGYDLPQAEVAAGDPLRLTLYWRATEPLAENYQVFAHLTRPTVHLWGQSDNLNPGEIPTARWPLDKYVWDAHELQVLPGTPPGDYQLTVGLYTLATGARVPVFDKEGQHVGDTLTLPTTVRVTRPHRPPDEDELGLTDVIHTEFGGQITLLGAVLPDRHIELPGFVHLALLWRGEVDHPNDVTVRVQLVDASGRVVSQIATPPVDGRYAASSWLAGEVVRDQYSLWLVRDFRPGAYELRVGLEDREGWVSLGAIEAVGQ